MIGIFLDIETNGLSVLKHRVIEIALRLIELPSQKEMASYSSRVFQPQEIWDQSDPKSLEINGFSYNMIRDEKTEETVREEIIALFKEHKIERGKAVYICQNPAFDRSFFGQLIDPEIQEKNFWPYHWLDLASMFWSLMIEKHSKENGPLPWETGISKNNISKYLGIEEEGLPHRAMSGVDHLIECYFALNTY